MFGSALGHGTRLRPGDLTVLTTDRGPAPMQIGAVLRLDEGSAPLDQPGVEEALEQLLERLSAIPRFRQRLGREPRPPWRRVWVDDPDFDPRRHVVALSARTEDELLEVAAELVCTRLDRNRPLWRLGRVSGLEGGGEAFVLVLHHAVTDGTGGLAVLRGLADEGGAGPPRSAPSDPGPPAAAAGPAVGRRWLGPLPGLSRLRGAVAGLRQLGLLKGRISLAEPTSYTVATGARRRLSVVSASLDEVVAAAHARGCTVNDLVVSSVVGAIAARLSTRGEHPRALVVSVPISGRGETAGGDLGNVSGVVPVRVPTSPDAEVRLRAIAEVMAPHRREAASQRVGREAGHSVRRAAGQGADRASSSGPMGVAFRLLARLGLFQAFVDRQRLVHTFVTNLRGPQVPLHLAGHLVRSVIPVAITPGNVGVTFDVLSYAGTLGITVVADPDVVPDQAELTAALERELRAFTPPPPSKERETA